MTGLRHCNVTIGGEVYPAAITMGAHKTFYELRGHEVAQPDTNCPNVEGCAWIYACVAVACRVLGTPFDLTLDDCCDRMTMQEYVDANNALTELTRPAAPETKKKRTAKDTTPR